MTDELAAGLKRWAVWRSSQQLDRFEAIDITLANASTPALPRPPGTGWEVRLITFAPTATKAIADTRQLESAGMLEPDAPWGDLLEPSVNLDNLVELELVADTAR